MNENQPQQEKDFNRLMENLNRFTESRDKIITEIENIIDRMKPETRDGNKMCSSPDGNIKINGIIYDLNKKVSDIDLSNERLATIAKRLNELF